MGFYHVVGSKAFFGAEIRKKGDIDVQRMYKELVPWFFKNGYFFTEKGISNKDTSAGQEQKFEWVASRKVEGYFRINMAVEIRILRLLRGKAELTARFKGYLETDYRNKFKGKFGNFLRNIYDRIIIANKVEMMKGTVKFETNSLIKEFKRVLNLVTEG